MPIYLSYYFWLVLISVSVFALERLFPRHRSQEILRPGFVQDLFWMVFNGQYISWMIAVLAVYILGWLNQTFTTLGLPAPESLRLLEAWPGWLQFTVFFAFKDFMEWHIHRAMHRVPWLWRLHQLHHSIEELDWAAAFRAHWGEVIVYRTLLYLPLVVLGGSPDVIFAVAAVSLLIQELSHANLRWDWGPLRYLVSSPAFHAWHHDIELHGKAGQNFGTNLVIWDWIFGTAYWPGREASPARLGFSGIEQYPRGIWGRLWIPFRLWKESSSLALPLIVELPPKKAAAPQVRAADKRETTKP